MNGYLAAAAGGALAGGGLASATRCLLPAPPPRLAAALAALDPAHRLPAAGMATFPPAGTPAEHGWAQRAGRLLARAVPCLLGWRTRPADLAILALPAQTLLGRQGLLALFGLLLPSLALAPLLAVGIVLPFTIPAGASLLSAALFFVVPAFEARDRATRARTEFRTALTAYFDLVALARIHR